MKRIDGFLRRLSQLSVTENLKLETVFSDLQLGTRTLTLFILASAVFLFAALPAWAETIYATGNDGTSLITIDSGSGVATVIGSTGTVETFATAFSPNGTLYTATNVRSDGSNSYLGYFDLATGAVTTVGGPLGVGYMTSLEFAPDGTLYGGSFGGPETYGTDNNLYTIDTATGTPTLVGALNFEGVMDFAFDSGGTLWAVGISDTSDSALYTINLTTGAGTYVRDITGAFTVMGIMFDSSGTLYASDHGSPSLLYRIDISTGAATTVGDTGIMMSHGGDISDVTPTANAETIYATGNDGTSLITIDSGSGVGTVIGPTGISDTFATAFSPDGTLYTTTNVRSDGSNSYLGYFDLATGAVTTVGGPLGVGFMTSLEFAPDGTLYGGSFGGPETYGTDNYLYTINTATGAPTLVGALNFEGVMDFAFDSNGTLWAVGISDTSYNALYTIDLATGAGTYVTDITGAFDVIMGIMFDSSDTLYASDQSGTSLLYIINTATGEASTAGSTGIMMAHGGDILTTPVYTLTINKSGTGIGTVTANTGTISWAGNTGTASYGSGTSVTLTASATTGSIFTGWSGACTGTGPCTVTMSAAKSVTANFTQVYTITGYVKTASNTGLSAVSMLFSGTLSGSPIPKSQIATTDATGKYTFTNTAPPTSGMVRPTKAGYCFSPASRPLPDVSIQIYPPPTEIILGDFIGYSYSISGVVKTSGGANLSGVTMTLSGGGLTANKTVTTASNGTYTFTGLCPGTYTLTPTKTTNQNFIVTTYSISGFVTTGSGTGISAVSVAITIGTTKKTATTAATTGAYTITDVPPGSYTVTPAKSGYVFTPASQSVTVSGANVTGVNFQSYSLSGKVTTSGGANLSGVTMTLSGGGLLLQAVHIQSLVSVTARIP
ncbi:MAG: carboxypeptidase regulatory-like domain-containing protein [Nitrospirae bacterium]|nr:carboxypeptidase regulatory-like domain-containing protein [Nitrospirota bacterium]